MCSLNRGGQAADTPGGLRGKGDFCLTGDSPAAHVRLQQQGQAVRQIEPDRP